MKKTIKTLVVSLCIGLVSYAYGTQSKLYSVTVTDQAITIAFPDAFAAQKVIDALAKRGSYQADASLNASQQEAAKREFVAEEFTEFIGQIVVTQRLTDAANTAISAVDVSDVPKKKLPTPTPTPTPEKNK